MNGMRITINVHSLFKLALVLALVMAACSCKGPEKTGVQGTSGEGREGVTTGPDMPGAKPRAPLFLTISPSDAGRDTLFYAAPTNFNFSDGRLEWLVNGAPVPDAAASSSFQASEVKKGDIVQARATGAGFQVLSNAVEIKNSPPAIVRIQMMPEALRPGDTMYVDAATQDIDDDPVTLSYEWTRNGQPAGTDRRISGPLTRGDKITVRVTPFDGEVQGNPVVLEREIRNMSPVITEHRELGFDGKQMTYQVKAVDPDGDPLTYVFTSAPAGMSMNPATGIILWTVPEGFTGTVPVAVSVSDGNGGSATVGFKITIK